MQRRIFIIASLIIVFPLTGCMSTQEIRDIRIGENPDLFNKFSPEIQAKVRQGQIDIGFTTDMVRLAWGSPDTVYTRTTRKKSVTVWLYSRTRVYPYTEWMNIPVHYHDSAGRQRIRYHSVWISWDTREEYTVAKVEFTRGRASAIEQLDRQPARHIP